MLDDFNPSLLKPQASEVDVVSQLAAFERNGFVYVGNVLTRSGYSVLRQICEQIMDGDRQYDGLFFQHDSASGRYEDLEYGRGWVGPSRAYRKIEGLERDPGFRAWIENPLFARFAQRHLGTEVSLYRAVLWTKAAYGGTNLPWHQDDGKFWGIDRAPSLQMWTALDDCPVESGCLQVIPGSHIFGLATPQGGTVPDEVAAAADAQDRLIELPARAGDVYLLHNHIWHRSGRNATGRPRRALTISYLAGSTRCLRRKRAPRQFVRVFDSFKDEADVQ